MRIGETNLDNWRCAAIASKDMSIDIPPSIGLLPMLSVKARLSDDLWFP